MAKDHFSVLVVEQVFSWTDPDGTRTIDFYIDPLLTGIIDGSIPFDTAEVVIDPVWVKEWLVKRDLDPVHLGSLTDDQIDTPVLGAWMEDGSVLLIDGSHRYMARYILAKPTVRYFLLGKDAWQKHAVIVRNA